MTWTNQQHKFSSLKFSILSCFPPNSSWSGPTEYNVAGVVYLTPSDQEALPYRITDLIPWNHAGRKNIGYLYAIHHGAKVSEKW